MPCLHLDGAAAADIARTCPCLTSFDLAGSAFPIPLCTTLRALLAFARLRHLLWRLALPLDALSVPKWRLAQTAAETRPAQWCFTALPVGESPVGTSVGVAAYLSGILLTLERLSAGREHAARDGLGRAGEWKAANLEAALAVLWKVRGGEVLHSAPM